MNIGIIGGGAVGLLFGAYFCDTFKIHLFTRRKAQAKSITEKGIKLIFQGKESICHISSAIDGYDGLIDQNFIIVAVKQYDVNSLLSVLNKVPKHIPLLFVQNGMGHLEFLHQLSHKTIFVSTIEHGVNRINDHTIIHTGIGNVNVAFYRGEQEEMEQFPLVNHSHFPIRFHRDYEMMLIDKLIANAVINPLTAILKVKNGRLIENPFFYRICLALFDEIKKVFPTLDKEQAWKKVEHICQQTKDNKSSMLKDVQAGRNTEVDAILGYCLKKGAKQGHALPITTIIYEMIKGLEDEGGKI